jgi:DcuC family C4-dicarboxylate transporter
MDVILTLLVIVLLILTIYRKIFPTMVLLFVGILVLIGYTVVTKTSVVGEAGSGNIYIDVYEFVRSRFTSSFLSMGVVLMPVVGYATYMNHLGASKLLAIKAIKPFRNLKYPYLICAVVTVLGAFLKLALPSQVGLLALLTVTIYPVMIAIGVSKASAGATCLLGTAFDWGPACPTTALVLANSTQQAQAPFFINFMLPIFPIGIVIAAVLSVLVNKYFDKKAGFTKEAEAVSTEGAESLGLPGYYALFPIIPLAIMIVCSDAVLGSVVITPFAATFLSFTVVVIIEAIRHKSILKSFEGSKQEFAGMGACFADMITLIASATVFAGGVELIGGFKTMSIFVINSGLPGILLIVAVCAMIIFMTMVVASSVPSTMTFAPFVMSIAQAGKITNEAVLLPLQASVGFSRSFSPISSAIVFMAKFLKIPETELIKRNMVPFLAALVTILLSSYLVMG